MKYKNCGIYVSQFLEEIEMSMSWNIFMRIENSVMILEMFRVEYDFRIDAGFTLMKYKFL